MDFDVLIVGAGAAGLSCALLLGSGLEKPYAVSKKVGLVAHQRAAHLSSALLNNALGIQPGTSGKTILAEGLEHLGDKYPGVQQILKEKVLKITFLEPGFEVQTNKNRYTSEAVVVATGYAAPFVIKGLEAYLEPHLKANPAKNRLQLANFDHLVLPGLYVAGSLAGHRSQFAIACGSGAAVGTDILSGWNNDQHSHVHDKL